MVASLFALLLASAPALLVQAIVTPSAPGPGAVFKQGSNCDITWAGDADSTTDWKNMAIELMTGDNFNMVHITTVATGQDGSVDGKFTFTCPEVTPNAAIYFYQFSSPSTSNLTWTTRFTIAGADGSTTAPSESKQPNGAEIPWGTGALKDPSKASPAPDFAVAAASSASAASVTVSVPVISSTPASSSSSVSSTTAAGAGGGAASGATTSPSRMTTVTSVPNQGASNGQTGAVTSPSPSTTAGADNNAAIGSVRVSGAVATLVSSALAFIFFF
ncbi:hypothetical protein K435DRAFT_56072 [Dendrothele bispora CBS 962.96]|uniref:Yeast cell wall synthesis Kre9/Knh1-like N-terminal domain-containing protein n=1 Tax=Dendrothele bispora (strain CBS 962.96) TaxID=1314807 RepID=A0A4S8M788_DENBC|nr:hypothetical protein K435DRAFT_56072 [Dendrothele bispora CBS 962.96]